MGSIKKESKISMQLVEKLLDLSKSSKHFVKAIGISISLGLLGLKSNDQVIAESLKPPCSPYMLDSMTVEQLLVQTICRQLILWDHIRPTDEWVTSQIPKFISEIVRSNTFLANLATSHILDSYLILVAGLCFSIGLRYAGTFDPTARKTILNFIKVDVPPLIKNFKHKSTSKYLRTCIIVSITALSMVMAGSGCLESFETIQDMYPVIGKDLHYGGHMAMNMALGLLFVGNGTCTVGTSNLAIASLFCSFFPLYPTMH